MTTSAWMAVWLSVQLLSTPDAGLAEDPLSRMAARASEVGLVAVTPQEDRGKWCRTKPVAEPAVRDVKEPSAELANPWGPALLEAMGTPTRTRALRLRETACPNLVFRVRVLEWRFQSDEAARKAEAAIAGWNHNSLELKSVHRLWREGDRVYFAESGAFAFWDRFEQVLRQLGVTRNSCQHR